MLRSRRSAPDSFPGMAEMAMMADFHLLTLLLLIPLLGIGLIWLAPRYTGARDAALIASMVALGVSLMIVGMFDRDASGFQMAESLPWIPELNIHFHLGIDGLSVLFLPATTLLFAAAVMASPRGGKRTRVYFSMILLLETTVLGVFVALDTMFMFLCWELTIVPIYVLVALWGVGAGRRHAATQYALLMLAAGVPLLFGLLIPALNAPSMSFDLPALLATPLPRDKQFLVFLLLLAGFGIKAPLPPFHTWLPLIAMEGPVAVVALIAGIKLGLYGLLRFAIPLAPEAAASLHWLLAGLGVVAVLHGALAALAQTNLRAMLAYAGISHVGLVLLGISSATLHGVQGALLLTISLVFATGGGFLATSFLQARIGSCDVQNLGGAFRTMPRLTVFFLVCGLAGLGIPGTLGFPGEWLVLVSTLQTHTGAGIAALAGMVFGGAYFLGLFRKCFLGPVVRQDVAEAQDLLPREIWVAVMLGLPILVFGVFPQPLLDITRTAVSGWLVAVGG